MSMSTMPTCASDSPSMVSSASDDCSMAADVAGVVKGLSRDFLSFESQQGDLKVYREVPGLDGIEVVSWIIDSRHRNSSETVRVSSFFELFGYRLRLMLRPDMWGDGRGRQCFKGSCGRVKLDIKYDGDAESAPHLCFRVIGGNTVEVVSHDFGQRVVASISPLEWNAGDELAFLIGVKTRVAK
mmetsp:Transcript_14143/g.34382  ORF Transcript_14143/g.34382 Transcript_14143/m.34382 type:complete len:184 (-) Transcript_14143:268-819(-)